MSSLGAVHVWIRARLRASESTTNLSYAGCLSGRRGHMDYCWPPMYMHIQFHFSSLQAQSFKRVIDGYSMVSTKRSETASFLSNPSQISHTFAPPDETPSKQQQSTTIELAHRSLRSIPHRTSNKSQQSAPWSSSTGCTPYGSALRGMPPSSVMRRYSKRRQKRQRRQERQESLKESLKHKMLQQSLILALVTMLTMGTIVTALTSVLLEALSRKKKSMPRRLHHRGDLNHEYERFGRRTWESCMKPQKERLFLLSTA